MKKFSYILILLMLGLTFASCNREEENIFDRSAAERVQDMQDKCEATLEAAPNGWEMLYFPNPDAAGYAFLCKFEDNGKVTFAAKNKISTNNKYTEEVSLWTTCANQGAVLSFNSYNTIFHVFADPGDDGVGYEGDYEFVIESVSAEEIRLKGRKHEAYIVMHPLAANQDWKDYFKQIDNFNATVFSGNEGIDMSYCNGDTVYQMTYEDGQFTYSKDGEDIALGFIVTPSGLHFYSGCPMTDSTVVAKNFVINDEQTRLVSTDQPEVFFQSNYTAADFFKMKFENKARWIYSEENSDATTVAAVETIKQLAAAKGASITRLGYERYETTQSSMSGAKTTTSYNLYVAYTVNQKLFEGFIKLNYSNDGTTISFSYKGVDSSLSNLLKRIDSDEDAAAQKLAAIFCDSFTPSSYTGSSLNMAQIYLTSSSKKIHFVADNELY